MHRPSAQEFLVKVLGALEDLPPDFAERLAEIVNLTDVDRPQAIRKLIEDSTRE